MDNTREELLAEIKSLIVVNIKEVLKEDFGGEGIHDFDKMWEMASWNEDYTAIFNVGYIKGMEDFLYKLNTIDNG